jgi:hypothetical protein
MDEQTTQPKLIDDENRQLDEVKPGNQTATTDNDAPKDDDQTLYLNRGGYYSSEMYKIEVKNLPRNFSYGVSKFWIFWI